MTSLANHKGYNGPREATYDELGHDNGKVVDPEDGSARGRLSLRRDVIRVESPVVFKRPPAHQRRALVIRNLPVVPHSRRRGQRAAMRRPP